MLEQAEVWRAVGRTNDELGARDDDSLRHFPARLACTDVVVIGDSAMAPFNEAEWREVWEICEDGYQTRSTILTSQLPGLALP